MSEPEQRGELREKLVSDLGERLELQDGLSVGWDGESPTFEDTQDPTEAITAAQVDLGIHEQRCMYLGLWLADMQEAYQEEEEGEEEESEEAGGGPDATPSEADEGR